MAEARIERLRGLSPWCPWTPKRREIFSWSSPIIGPILLLLIKLEIPGTSPLFATGLGALGRFGWRRKRDHVHNAR